LRQNFEFGLQPSERVSIAAASVGRVDLLEILTGDYGCDVGLSTYCCRFIWENYPVDQSDSRVCTAAASGGHLHCIKLLKCWGFASDLTTACAAASSGSTEAVVYLIESGCTTREEGMVPLLHFAARGGNIATLEWVVKRFGYEPNFNDTIARGAIESSQLHILDWKRERVVPPSSWGLTLWRQAAYVGDLRVLDWGWNFARSFDTPDSECTIALRVSETKRSVCGQVEAGFVAIPRYRPVDGHVRDESSLKRGYNRAKRSGLNDVFHTLLPPYRDEATQFYVGRLPGTF